MSNYKKKRKIKKRKAAVKRIFLLLLAVVITAGAVETVKYIKGDTEDINSLLAAIGMGGSKKVEKAKELVLPDWIDTDIIHIHSTARTGLELEDIKNIVVHYVGNPNTSAKNNRDYFDKADTRVSSHFVVGLDGEIIQCVPLFERSAASNDRNKDTISIEVCHPDESGKFNFVTEEALTRLCVYLCEKFSLDENDIIRHYDITGKICPKYYVEHEDKWRNFKEKVKDGLNEK